MLDPVSITSFAAGLISLGIEVSDGLFRYYHSYKNQEHTAQRATSQLEVLLNTLNLLEKTIATRSFRSEDSELISTIESAINDCEDAIQELKQEYELVQGSSAQGLRGSMQIAGRRIAYPFRESTFAKLNENISAIQHNIRLAMDVLQLRDYHQIQDDITTAKQVSELMRITQVSNGIIAWLKAPDASVDHNAACAKRHPGTGLWFVKGAEFTTWLYKDNSFIWINGFAGCGKSVLCSTAIQFAFRQKQGNPRVGVAFFYFTFNDERKQDSSALLRTLLLQIAGQSPTGIGELSALYDSYKSSTPPESVLLAYLHRLIATLDHVYIIIDALDEVPRGRLRRAVLTNLESMRAWESSALHLLVTSRDEVDIRDGLQPTTGREVVMIGGGIDQDISDFVTSCLKTDKQLLKWKDHHDLIQETLTAKAHGIFRWIECQLESIRQCPRVKTSLECCLESLPVDLDESYERILCSVRRDSIDYVHRVLTVLCFSMRPLTFLELRDAVAVDLNGTMQLDRNRRFADLESVQDICVGLIRVNDQNDGKPRPDDNKSDGPERLQLANLRHATVSMAHFSVQEYLESARIMTQSPKYFGLNRSACHALIAQICLVYLVQPETAFEKITTDELEDLPLYDYAASTWYLHYVQVVDQSHPVHTCVSRLFEACPYSFQNWTRLYRVRKSACSQRNHFTRTEELPFPLHIASYLGIRWLVIELLDHHADINTRNEKYATALQIASETGHTDIVHALLERGASINFHDEHHDCALQMAAARGHPEVVQMLLERGADINILTAYFDQVLYRAASRGHVQVVQILLDHGASVNSEGGLGDSNYALKFTPTQLMGLLDRGKEVVYFESALWAAKQRGHSKVVELLLERGAHERGPRQP